MLKRFVFLYQIGYTRSCRNRKMRIKVISSQDKRLATIHFKAQMDNDGLLPFVSDMKIIEGTDP